MSPEVAVYPPDSAVRQQSRPTKSPQFIVFGMKFRSQAGFTLYELMITLLIIGIVLALGIPNFTSLAANSRVAATSNDLHAAFELARSEALRSKTPITICASDNSTVASAGCQGRWQDGFIVFMDNDGNLQRDNIAEPVIRANPAIANGVRLAVADDARYFSFAASGFGRGNVDGIPAVSRIIVCDERGLLETSSNRSAAHLLIATPVGHTSVVTDYELVNSAASAMAKDCP